MRPLKSPRGGPLPDRTRSSRDFEVHGKSTSPSRAARSEKSTTQEQEKAAPPAASSQSSSYSSKPAHRQVISTAIGHDTSSIDALRKKMSEAMAQKQYNLASTAHAGLASNPTSAEELEVGNSLSQRESSSEEFINTGTISTDSAGTIKASVAMTPGTVRTPSYPFPRMQLRLNRGSSHRSAPSHKPFTLLSPTNEPSLGPSQQTTGQVPETASSELSTPTGQAFPASQGVPEDPEYPAPDLYDIILMLNAEPGLDMWWANLTDILSESYGAERASLALPGDVTDLENVPWGQKATFNLYGSESGGLSALESLTTSEADSRSIGKPLDNVISASQTTSPLVQRPGLQTRHSIAGVSPDLTRSYHRPSGPVRAVSSIGARQEENEQLTEVPKLTKRAPTPRAQSTLELDLSRFPRETAFGSETANLRCHVRRSLQPLESEPDALLVRNGVAALFGKRKPVLLTRDYSEDSCSHSPRTPSGFASEDERSAASRHRDQSKKRQRTESSDLSMRTIRVIHEYEQPEPSPWAQSPSPSPAARPDPSESPFFVQQSTVDESAFEQNPPPFDYAASANQPLSAIGADMSRTLVHIPLIQPVPARGVMATTLRFPIAILSFLSPINPYPNSLRHSLITLLPHLAVSFSLAQQYSSLQERSRGGTSQRHNPGFGLGGTFSDENSELELVAELSGQIAQGKLRHSSFTRHDGTHSSHHERDGMVSISPGPAGVGTQLHEHIGMSPGLPLTPGLSGTDLVEGYFSAKRQRQPPRTPGDDGFVKPKMPQDKDHSTNKMTSRKTASVLGKPLPDSTVPQSPRPGSQASESEYGDVSEALDRFEHGLRRSSQHRDSTSNVEGETTLPELISSLMLNAVPLQLFLAKPSSGDLVWTNRKFDAFRSQGEGRVRDPWKNVHVADRPGLAKLWSEALISGSQFTHYIRVRRFNSDNDFRWFVFRASTLLSNNGRLLYWIGSFLDVHEHYIKTLEATEREATMARDAKIRALADAIPQVLFEALEDEGIVSVNQQWHAYSGQTLDEARGLGFARHVHRDDLHKCGVLSSSDAAAIKQLSKGTDSNSSSSSNKTAHPAPQKTLFAPDLHSLDHMIRQGAVTVEKDENGRTSYLTEIRLRSRGGEYRWHLVRLVRVDSAILSDGRASWYGTCTDIENRKTLEKELNQANQKVHSEMESKTKFFANMSHEIRTPLNGILGSMPWLVESVLDHDQRRTVDTIQNSANNLRELVDNILDVTKVEAGKMALLPRWFHVRTLCEEVIDTVSSRAIERGLELNYSLDSQVPANVRGDPFRVRQVLLNLLGNSVKFTEQGEVYMACSLREDSQSSSAEKPTCLLTFQVVDTGRGFNENEFQRLFTQFGQVGGGSNNEAGSGLGLFLSKQLVEMHGGELSVESQAGEGSSFSFYIRVEVAAPGEEIQSPPATSKVSRQRQRSSISQSSRSQSESKTTTLNARGQETVSGVIQTPGLSKYVSSPEAQSPSPSVSSPPVVSPPLMSAGSSGHSARSNSVGHLTSTSSSIPTPESMITKENAAGPTERELRVAKAVVGNPLFRRTKSDNDGSGLAPDLAHPAMYSIVIICPAEHARAAIKQHIEHVVPLQIPTNVTTLPDIGSFLNLMNGPASPTFTHIVLDIPASSDVMLFVRQMANFTAAILPSLVVVTDHYQKRDIQEDFQGFVSSGRKAFLIHKPVKPSVFALIFDPAQLRNLSRDRAKEVAQSSRDDFRTVANMVKDAVGGRSLRVLLVEDSDVNRMVIVRYLKKVALDNEEAKDGQECIDKVLSKAQGHYSLIICDIQMPRKNGYETCMEIRQWERANGFEPVPIMALTANAMPEERSAAAAAGFSDYMTKPVDFNVLGSMMIALLDSKIPHLFLRDRPMES